MEKFKGYYFKCSSNEHTVALIPASHGNRASLQIITDQNSFLVDYRHILFGKTVPRVKIGESAFSERKIVLNVNRTKVKAEGALYFGGLTPLKYDIMGAFKPVAALMQCRHRVISMKHKVNGSVRINGEVYVFKNDCGYIEGDEGRSFPKKYIWAQGFFEEGSVMMSIAEVPLAGAVIEGVIAVVYAYGKEYRLATYLGAKTVCAGDGYVEIRQGKYTLTIKRLSGNSHKLLAPKNGKMNRIIRESPKCELYCRLKKSSVVIAEFISESGSFESEV